MTEGRQDIITVDGLRVDVAATGAGVILEIGFAVAEGHVLGVVGESGSGKSTLAHAILGYARSGLRIASGRIVVDGHDVLGLDKHSLRRLRATTVSYVPQDPGRALNPSMRVGGQILEALQMTSADHCSRAQMRARIERVLGEVQLRATPGLLRSYPHQLSGGQQQRIALAMAFVCRPRVIVLDEPTTGLDVSTQKHVLETVRTLCDSYQVGAIYVSHDLAVVSELADAVAVMYAGRIVEVGPTSAVFSHPAHRYTRRLIQAVPTGQRDLPLIGIAGRVPSPGHQLVGCAFAPRCDIATEDCRKSVPGLTLVGNGVHRARCIHPLDVTAPPPSLTVASGRRTEATDTVLSVDRLDAYYSSKQVLHAVSASVRAGQCLAVVGESGSGKTTLARCVVGLHTRYTGDVRFGSMIAPPGVHSRSNDTIRGIQYIFQNPHASLNPLRSVRQSLERPLHQFWPSLTGAERLERMAAALADVALDASTYLEKVPFELSGGEAQRVAIARALLAQPTVLVCDEVTASLDASVQAVIIQLLRGLQITKGLALVFITHNLALVRNVAQQVIVLHRGQVVEDGSATQVIERPIEQYTADLFLNTPSLIGIAAPDQH